MDGSERKANLVSKTHHPFNFFISPPFLFFHTPFLFSLLTFFLFLGELRSLSQGLVKAVIRESGRRMVGCLFSLQPIMSQCCVNFHHVAVVTLPRCRSMLLSGSSCSISTLMSLLCQHRCSTLSFLSKPLNAHCRSRVVTLAKRKVTVTDVLQV